MPDKAGRYTGRKKPSAVKKFTVAQKAEELRGSAAKRGYNHRWRAARLVHLAEFPLCNECEKHKIITEATIVDHITPHRGNQELFWNPENWQSLCAACHNRKTAKGA